ncbi:trehalose-phosphatase [Parvularcula marina]|uniref:trehalose-phosphatase n=1 Tax=Parvularcula marina TaxID=2292771 RepID=UPI003516FC8A
MTLPSLSPDHALFLDFDGTLTDIQDDPDTVVLPQGGAEALVALSARIGGALAVISGRDVTDLQTRVPQELWRIGGHGLDVASPGETAKRHEGSAPDDLLIGVRDIEARHPGSRLEEKGRVLAFHYRQIPEHADHIENELRRLLNDFPAYRLQSGKMVFEAKPSEANKGAALAKMMSAAPFEGRTPIMVGDDATDEDAMKTALEIGGTAIKVGAGETVAPYRIDDPQAVWSWLSEKW